jgi:hypothetical protein
MRRLPSGTDLVRGQTLVPHLAFESWAPAGLAIKCIYCMAKAENVGCDLPPGELYRSELSWTPGLLSPRSGELSWCHGDWSSGRGRATPGRPGNARSSRMAFFNPGSSESSAGRWPRPGQPLASHAAFPSDIQSSSSPARKLSHPDSRYCPKPFLFLYPASN